VEAGAGEGEVALRLLDAFTSSPSSVGDAEPPSVQSEVYCHDDEEDNTVEPVELVDGLPVEQHDAKTCDRLEKDDQQQHRVHDPQPRVVSHMGLPWDSVRCFGGLPRSPVLLGDRVVRLERQGRPVRLRSGEASALLGGSELTLPGYCRSHRLIKPHIRIPVRQAQPHGLIHGDADEGLAGEGALAGFPRAKLLRAVAEGVGS